MSLTNKTYLELLNEASQVDVSKLEPPQRIEFLGYYKDISVKAARENFYIFVKMMMPEVIPNEFRDGIHLRVMCGKFQEVFDNVQKKTRKGKKLRLSVPPGSSKTIVGTVLFPAWCLGRHPNWRILAVSHSSDHAEQFMGRPTKHLVNSDAYREIFPLTNLAQDSKASGFWSTTRKGYYAAVGVTSGVAGKRCNLLICDDILQEQTAYSKREREGINNTYHVGLRTRMLPEESAEIMIQTRWNLNDPAGFVEEIDKEAGNPWEVVAIPALLDSTTLALYASYSSELPTQQYHLGGSYWPEFKPVEELLDMKATLPPGKWSAVYMQNPIPEEGSIFKETLFRKWSQERPPAVTNIIVSFDTAFTESERKDAARSAYTVWGIFAAPEVSPRHRENVVGNLFLLGAEAGYWSFPELIQKCEWLQGIYKSDLDLFLIEERASGISLIQELRARGFPVATYMPDKSKEARAWAVTPFLEAGRVWINPIKQFTKDFLTEVLSFPNADLKDFVDCLSLTVLWLRDNMQLIPQQYLVYQDIYEDDNIVKFRRPKTYWGSS